VQTLKGQRKLIQTSFLASHAKKDIIREMQATTKITMHNGENVHPFTVGTEFGTFDLEIDKIAMTTKVQEINIVIDQSGSMDEMCEDGNSKMHQIKHVTNNILHFVSEKCKDVNVKVGLHSFNTRVNTLFECTNVTETTIDALTFHLKHIRAEDGTNIEEPLKMLSSFGTSASADINNILMSDGDANEGNTDPNELAHMIDTRASNYFIGFGLDHNPRLFSALSNRENSNYYFIDKIEKSGIAYGEILQSILYRAYNGVIITIENGMLYDWKTNEWRTELFVGKMSGEMKRTFHILTTAKEMVQIKVAAQKVENGEEIVLNTSWNADAGADLTKLFYRQRTQEILYNVKKLNEEKIVDRDAVKTMKIEMKKFTAEMVGYMKQNGLSDDRLMKNLCDDIVVVYRTIGTQWGHMYSCSRQVSQGTERAHNTSDTPTSPREKLNSGGLTPRNTRSTHIAWDLPDDIHVFNPRHRRWVAPTRSCSVMPSEGEIQEEEEDEDEELINNHEMSALHYTKTQSEVIESIVGDNNV